MRRHFLVTLWRDEDGERLTGNHGFLDLDPWVEASIETARLLGAHYLAWGLEDGRLEREASPPPLAAEVSDEAEVESALDQAPEEGAGTGLHIHLYLELQRTVRWTTVVNKFQRRFRGAHVEPRRGWRSTAREYTLGLKHGLPKPSAITAGEWGEWRDDTPDSLPDDIAAAAAALILGGGSPKEAALRWPRWFLRHGGGVIRLWETIRHRKWNR